VIPHAQPRYDPDRLGPRRHHLPVWCEVSPEERASRLYDNEGRCVHLTSVSVIDPVGKRVWGEAPRFCASFELALRTTTNPAGREIETADVLVNGEESNLGQLQLLAAAISELADPYYATTGSA
jgi:hypothetical protein